MRPTDVLMSEHRVIEQVLSCLEKMAARAVEDGTLDRSSARQAVDFFQTFADHCHHAKEENHLFPLMEARGFSRSQGPTGVMLAEHEMGRECLRGMAAAIDPAAEGDTDAVRLFADHARNYVDLLRQHILKEDQRLFPMANHRLTGEDQQALLRAFADVEDRDLHAGTHEKYLHVADDLARRFDVPRTPLQPVAGHGCSCGHHG
jgi:hemerythrin-like domain-containing protein